MDRIGGILGKGDFNTEAQRHGGTERGRELADWPRLASRFLTRTYAHARTGNRRFRIELVIGLLDIPCTPGLVIY